MAKSVPKTFLAPRLSDITGRPGAGQTKSWGTECLSIKHILRFRFKCSVATCQTDTHVRVQFWKQGPSASWHTCHCALFTISFHSRSCSWAHWNCLSEVLCRVYQQTEENKQHCIMLSAWKLKKSYFWNVGLQHVNKSTQAYFFVGNTPQIDMLVLHNRAMSHEGTGTVWLKPQKIVMASLSECPCTVASGPILGASWGRHPLRERGAQRGRLGHRAHSCSHLPYALLLVAEISRVDCKEQDFTFRCQMKKFEFQTDP